VAVITIADEDAEAAGVGVELAELLSELPELLEPVEPPHAMAATENRTAMAEK
jgi:hypothetical protein